MIIIIPLLVLPSWWHMPFQSEVLVCPGNCNNKGHVRTCLCCAKLMYKQNKCQWLVQNRLSQLCFIPAYLFWLFQPTVFFGISLLLSQNSRVVFSLDSPPEMLLTLLPLRPLLYPLYFLRLRWMGSPLPSFPLAPSPTHCFP